jgi:uncharacterized coiled-coil DUF342 family protein
MAEKLKTPADYRVRADELRTTANDYSSEARAILLEIAAHYDALAESVTAIERSKEKLNQTKE